jgi:hypothetical protein
VSSNPKSLSDALERLRAWLASLDGFPGWRDVRIIEVGPRTDVAGIGARVWRAAEDAVRTPDAYSARFEELLGAGYSWINLSCYGLLGDVAMIAIELPRETSGIPSGKTSVNFSGPPIDVATRAVRWSAEGYVVIVPNHPETRA